jgi:hypothetical protein
MCRSAVCHSAAFQCASYHSADINIMLSVALHKAILPNVILLVAILLSVNPNSVPLLIVILLNVVAPPLLAMRTVILALCLHCQMEQKVYCQTVVNLASIL